MPRAEYARRRQARATTWSAAERTYVVFGNLRAAVFVTAAALAYAAFWRGSISGWWLALPALAFIWGSVRLHMIERTRDRAGRAVAFYDRALARMDHQWAGSGAETGERFLRDDHLYARDLDLFGPGSLFELINSARTRLGEQALADWFNERAAPATVRARQDAIAELAPRIDLREDLAVLGDDVRGAVEPEALAQWAEAPPRFASSTMPAWILVVAAAGAVAAIGLIVWLAAQVGALTIAPDTLTLVRLYVLAMLLVSGLVTWTARATTGALFSAVDAAARDLGVLSGVLARLEHERFSSPRLVDMRAALDTAGEPPSRRIARLQLLVGLVDSRAHFLVRLIGHLLVSDLLLAYALEGWRRTSGGAVRRWLDAVGEIEALCSLGAYSYEHPEDVFPELVDLDGEPLLEASGLGHPLLDPATMVRNDVALTGDLRALVVSGSNMSGKSTLLRAIGVNVVLAQAGAPVRAHRLRLTPLEIGASIQVHDSLQTGVSRFYAEITRIGAIMGRASERRPLLFLIDELLHGTNSHDRRIGAEAIVRGLVERGAIGLVTTHDLALAGIADALAPSAANVHFEDTIENGTMRFDYRMRPGVVEKSNALELMRSVGLDV